MTLETRKPSFLTSLISGGIAGTVTDIALFPLDTIKTRLQSAQGFRKSGGFRGVYKGLSAAAVGSAPGAAMFFSTYEMSKQYVEAAPWAQTLHPSLIHMACASLGEVVACLVRVPTEVVKQRMQAGLHSTIASVVRETVHSQGMLGLYQGFGITIMREIPFSLIQFPLYELLKKKIRDSRGGKEPLAIESAACGSVSGGLAAAMTTPLDVIKTRLMIGKDASGRHYTGLLDTIARVMQEGREADLVAAAAIKNSAGAESGPKPAAAAGGRGAMRVLFSGLGPRVMWISIGGFVFFGAYEEAKALIMAL